MNLQGTKIQATSFNDDATLFDSMFQVYKSYMVSNGTIRKSQHTQQIVKNDFQLILNSRTIVEEVTELSTQKNMPEYNFVTLNAAAEHINEGNKFGKSKLFLFKLLSTC